MRVTQIELDGIGPFDGAVFEVPEQRGPGELVLFEGPNGSGKTTIVQAIAVAAGKPRRIPWITLVKEAGACPPGNALKRRLRVPTATARVIMVHDDDAHTANLFDADFLAPSSEGNTVDARLIGFHAAAVTAAPAICWAAFAYRPHQAPADLSTPGPRQFSTEPLEGCLSFGEREPASKLLGQFLTNLEFDRVKAAQYGQHQSSVAERKTMAEASEALQASLSRVEEAMSRVLDRAVKMHFPLRQQTPRITFDGEEIPLDLLGDGMSSTVSWLSDLLVRLERTRWEDTTLSPLDQDFWLILDEIDEGLHPRMQSRILPVIRKLFPNARIYATTHSPFVVASVGEGYIFPIRPNDKHRVTGRVEGRALAPGQSLELVVTEIFDAHAGFVDEQTREDLAAHKRDIRTLQRTGQVEWDSFLERRRRLLQLNDEVRAVVAMQELPVRTEIDAENRKRQDAADSGEDEAEG